MNIESLTLHTRVLAQQRAFYVDTLGLTVESEDEHALALRIGTTRLTFVQDESFGGFYHFAFSIPKNQFDAAYGWMEARIPLLTDEENQSAFELSSPWNSQGLYFDDADGNIAELIARHDLDNASGEPFGPQSLLCVSEIGLVVPDVPERVRELTRTYNLQPFDGVSDTFTAVGTHDGMFITVPEGRGWFPVGRPAVSAPFELSASTPDGELSYRQEATP